MQTPPAATGTSEFAAKKQGWSSAFDKLATAAIVALTSAKQVVTCWARTRASAATEL